MTIKEQIVREDVYETVGGLEARGQVHMTANVVLGLLASHHHAMGDVSSSGC